MKNTLAIIICLIASTAIAQSKKDITKNNVKSITEVKYDYSDGIEEKAIESKMVYNNEGELIELKEYKKGDLDKHEKYSYDSKGNRIKQIKYDEKGKIDEIIEYKYSGDLRTERIEYYPNGKIKNKKVYTYEYYPAK